MKTQLRERLRASTMTELLTAAESVLAENGVQASSMALIAKTAGVSVGCLYNYFEEKEQLISYIIERRKNELLGLIHIETQKNKHGDFHTKLAGFIRVVVEYLSFHVSYSKIIFSSDSVIPYTPQGSNSDKQGVKSLSIIEEFVHCLLPIILQGIREGFIKIGSEEYFSYVILGMIRGVFQYRVQANLFSPQEDSRLILELYLSGIKSGHSLKINKSQEMQQLQ